MDWSYMIVVLLLTVVSCSAPEEHIVFEYMPPDRTGIDFANNILENDTVNILTYEYLYNGGGVAACDLNNDGLDDLFFTANQGPNMLFLNKGDFRFENKTTNSGTYENEPRWSTGVSIADINQDGWMDIYVSNSGPGSHESRANYLYINQGRQPDGSVNFQEKAKEMGLDAPGTYTTHATFLDYDLDGDLDAFLLNHANVFYNPLFNSANLRASRHRYFGNKLFRNDNGKYIEVSEEAGILGSGLNFGLSVSVSDINGDFYPDIYVTNDYDEQDFLYINNGNGTFTQALNRMMTHISKFGMGSDIADVNNDILPDVVVLDMLPEDNLRQKLLKGAEDYEKYSKLIDSGYHHQFMRNSLQLNLGTQPGDSLPLFSEIGQLAGISNTDWSWAPLIADYDLDGWPDLYVTNGYLRDFTNLDFVKYIYPDAIKEARKSNQELDSWEVVQKMPQTKIPNYMFSNQHGYTFRNVTDKWKLKQPSVSTGAAYTDLDQDGDLDLVVNNINDNAFIIRNEMKPDTNHHLKIQIRPDRGERWGVGSKVQLYTPNGIQIRELYTTRGFQSSVPPYIHFGLGKETNIDSLVVTTPYGKQSVYYNINVDSVYNLQPNHSLEKERTLVTSNTSRKSVHFNRHTPDDILLETPSMEPEYNDFKVQGLLPFQVSKVGPQVTIGDVNRDGLEDYYVTGTSEKSGILAVQRSEGIFTYDHLTNTSDQKKIYETGAEFADVNGDGAEDLIILAGSSLYPEGSPRYRNRVMINNGKGDFKEMSDIFSQKPTSSMGIAATDFDKDGLIDVYIGGSAVPHEYPKPSPSFLGKNRGSGNNFNFQSLDSAVINREMGLVNDAVWADTDGDDWPDLIVTGDFMPLRIFKNERGKLQEITQNLGLEKSNGFWKSITPGDLDNDGDVDFVLGNFGNNTQLRAGNNTPVSIYYGDFDKNGSIDPILAWYIDDVEYPWPSRDQITGQLRILAKKYTSYQSYAETTMQDVLQALDQKNPAQMKVYELRSCWAENKGNRFILHPLPSEAQFSMVNASVIDDFDQDGHQDILLGGNYYPMSHHLGQMDANKGVLLFGNGSGQFKAKFSIDYGLDLSGDLRSIGKVRIGDKNRLIVGYSNGKLAMFDY